jgi:hypothetical protein
MGRIGLTVLLGIAMVNSIARGADAPATTQVTADEKKAPEPRCKLTDLFRSDIRNRRLDIVLIPPNWFAKAASGSSSSVLTEGASDDRWYIEAAARDRREDGSYHIFQASCDDRLDDRYASLRLTLVSHGDDDALSVAGAGRVDNLWVLVNFTQDPGAGPVHFSVQRPRRRMRPIHEFEAPDLLSLWNDHAKELRQFLLPLLREMTGTNVLRPRPGDVYRAFPSIAADEQTTRKLTALLPALDADGATERESASVQLQALGPAGILAAVRLESASLTAEQGARLDALVRDNSTTAEPQALAKRDPLFLCDCLEDPDVNVRTAALQALRSMTGRAIAFDVAAPADDRAKAVAAVIDSLDDFTVSDSTNNTAVPARAGGAGAGFNP